MADRESSQRLSPFQRLKPLCTRVADLALQGNFKVSNKGQIIQALEALLQTLSIVRLETGNLTSSISDYVFFPLSHLFRQALSLPSKVLELSLRCLQVLLMGPWCRDDQSEVHLQLLNLLSFLINGNPSSGDDFCLDEAVIIVILGCLENLFEPCATGSRRHHITSSERRLLILGHVTTNILECVSHPSKEVSTAASETLQTVITAVESTEILRRFTPGIISTITKLLKPSTWSKRSSRAIVAALSVLENLLSRVLVLGNDSKTLRDSADWVQGTQRSEDSWLRACLPQLQHALLNIFRIKALDKSDVTEGLFGLCLSLLCSRFEYWETLNPTILETLLELSSLGHETTRRQRKFRLAKKMTFHAQVIPLLKDTLQRYLMGMSRLVLSHDTSALYRHMDKITTCYEIANDVDVDLSILDTDLVAQIFVSATALLDMNNVSPAPLPLADTTRASEDDRNRLSVQDLDVMLSVRPCGTRNGETLEHFGRFVRRISQQRSSSRLESHFTKSVTVVKGRMKSAHLWTSSRVMEAGFQQTLNTADHQAERLGFYDAIYSTSLDVLRESSLEPVPDWRLQVTALQVLAMYASMQGPKFRHEFVDGLYPVIESLATSNPQVREYAWLCIRIISRACGYHSTNELIIQNIDYLINSVALKMNISAIGLEAPKVLVMLVRICRVTIVPFLDDIIDSVFSTLAAYHGYPQLVEALFNFLGTVVSVSAVNERAQGPNRLDQTKGNPIHEDSPITALVDVMQIDSQANCDTKFTLDMASLPSVDQGAYAQHDLSSIARVETNTATIRTIVALGQYYLTHNSPSLRCQVLTLIGRSCGVLHIDENSFLPLVHETWPVVVKRLYDSESSVCIAACNTISDIIYHTGQFTKSRIEDEWPEMLRLYQQKHQSLEHEEGDRVSRGSVKYSTWEALIVMFCGFIATVQLNDEVEDDLMVILEPYYGLRADVRCALHVLNQDALWLRKQLLLSSTTNDLNKVPQLEGYKFSFIGPSNGLQPWV